MVNFNEVVIKSENGSRIDVGPILDMYEKACSVYITPSIPLIYDLYMDMAQGRLANVKAREMPDDFYDGSPESRPDSELPDFLRHNISEYIRMNYDITMEEMQEVLEAYRMFHEDGGELRHPPTLGVW